MLIASIMFADFVLRAIAFLVFIFCIGKAIASSKGPP